MRQSIKAFSRNQSLAALTLAIAVLAAYLSLSQGLPGDFLLDDHARIKNAQVEDATMTGILAAVMETDSGTFGRVIPLVSLYATKAISGEDPALFRLQNIALHLITGLAVFWFLGRLLSTKRLREHIPDNAAWLVAAICTALWLLHPIQVSTALYSVQRMTQFSTLFTLFALICYIAAREMSSKNIRSCMLPVFGLAVFSFAALLSKESAALIPFFIFLIEYFTFKFKYRTLHERNFVYGCLLIFSILPILAGFIYFITHTETLLHDYVMRSFTLSERIATESLIMWQYIGMLLLPRLSSMALYHDGITIHEFFSVWSLLAIAAWMFAIGIAFRLRNRYPLAAFGFLFFVVSHLLESTILPLELMFEHRNYIGSVGIMLLLLALLLSLSRHIPRLQPTIIATLIVIVSGFSLLQAARASIWSDPYAYALIAAKENPRSSRAVSMLANYQARRGHPDEAKGLLQATIEQKDRKQAVPGLMLHLVLFHCYEEEIPQRLLDSTRNAIETYPLDTYVLSGLKAIRQRLNQGDCPGLKRSQYLSFIETAASNPRTRSEYKFFFKSNAGLTHAEMRQFDDARRYLEHAMEFSGAVSLNSRREHAIALAQVCIGLENRECTDTALKRAQNIDDRISRLIGKDSSMMSISKLESIRDQLFSDTVKQDPTSDSDT